MWSMDLVERARRFAALGDPTRLAIVDDLAVSDRSPSELTARHGLASNLLAHHLDVLEEAELVERAVSSGDGRRRYVRLRHDRLIGLRTGAVIPGGPVLFVCTHNSARSQLAAALWQHHTGQVAASAGTHPAARVAAGAVGAARRAGLDLSDAVPRRLDQIDLEPAVVITVCDRAHEELEPGENWWHWSTPDPIGDPDPDAFDRALDRLRRRITTLTGAAQHD
jgi:protein-tyrosine-phosphatase